MNEARELRLLKRVMDSIADAEEYLDEVYAYVNRDPNGRPYGQTFRLADIIASINGAVAMELIASRTENSWPAESGIGRVLYSMTEAGRDWWTANVKGAPDLFC